MITSNGVKPFMVITYSKEIYDLFDFLSRKSIQYKGKKEELPFIISKPFLRKYLREDQSKKGPRSGPL